MTRIQLSLWAFGGGNATGHHGLARTINRLHFIEGEQPRRKHSIIEYWHLD
jgi:hypothetical protein